MLARYLIHANGREIKGIPGKKIARAMYHGTMHGKEANAVKVAFDDNTVMTFPADQEVSLVSIKESELTTSEWWERRNRDHTELNELLAEHAIS